MPQVRWGLKRVPESIKRNRVQFQGALSPQGCGNALQSVDRWLEPVFPNHGFQPGRSLFMLQPVGSGDEVRSIGLLPESTGPCSDPFQ